jgi:hypothetical protein
VNEQQFLAAMRAMKTDIMDRIDQSDQLTSAKIETVNAEIRGIRVELGDVKSAVNKTNGTVGKHVTAIHDHALELQRIRQQLGAVSDLQLRHNSFTVEMLRDHEVTHHGTIHPAVEQMEQGGSGGVDGSGRPRRRRPLIPVVKQWQEMPRSHQFTVKIVGLSQAIIGAALWVVTHWDDIITNIKGIFAP